MAVLINELDALNEAVRRFAGISGDHTGITLRTGALYDPHRGKYLLDYLGERYEISPDGSVQKEASREAVPYNDQVLILQYLCSASGLPPRGHWLSFLELPHGELHHAPFQHDALIPLARAFGHRLEAFSLAARILGGEKLSLGDCAAKFLAFPKLPLAVIIWSGDEEFPPRASILFDAVAPTHLSTAALWVLGVELARKIIALAQG